MKRTILILMIAVITHTVIGQTVFDSFDSAIDSNYTVIVLGMSDSSRIIPFQENQIVYEGQEALRLEYTVESVATSGGVAILQLQHPDLQGVWDFSGFESLSVAFYNKTPSSWPGRAIMRIHLYDVSNITPSAPLLATEWWYSFHNVLNRDTGWHVIDLPLKDVGHRAALGDGGTGFWLTGWAGILGNDTLDLDQIRGIGIEVSIFGPLDYELIRGEFILDNLIFNPKSTAILSSEQISKRFALEQNYPNPFNPTTTIVYSIPENAFVTMKVYDILGKEITTLINERKSAGNYSINFNASNLPSGVYFYRMQAESFVSTKKFVLLK